MPPNPTEVFAVKQKKCETIHFDLITFKQKEVDSKDHVHRSHFRPVVVTQVWPFIGTYEHQISLATKSTGTRISCWPG